MLDDNQRPTVTGSRSELILRGGTNVSPFEVEQALLDHPEVLEAAVYGIVDELLAEQVAAAAIVTATAESGLAALRAFLADRLARYTIPDHIWVLDSLPRNSMGKVLNSELPMPANPLAD